MKILVIFTGGTIRSAVSDGWISPSDDMKYLLINKFRETTDDEIQFDTLAPYTILSENLSAENLNMLIKCVRDNIDSYDGIIVTHGTDTLQYSAAALALVLGDDCNPIVLVSSNFPLEDKRSNGLPNFIAAVEFIKSGCGSGVFVSYKNKDENTKIHRATEIVSHVETFDEIYSIDNQPFAVYDHKIILNPKFKSIHSREPIAGAEFCHNSGILSVVAMPGDSFCYDLSQYKAVILRPYHSGTLNTSSTEFVSFCKKAKDMEVQLFVVNAPEGVTYNSAESFDDLGLISLKQSAFPSVYMKLWLAISLNEDICRFLLDNS